MTNAGCDMEKKRYVSPMMAMAVMDGLQMVCQSGVTGGNGLSGVGYGGVDEEGTKVPSVKEFNDFRAELDKMDW